MFFKLLTAALRQKISLCVYFEQHYQPICVSHKKSDPGSPSCTSIVQCNFEWLFSHEKLIMSRLLNIIDMTDVDFQRLFSEKKKIIWTINMRLCYFGWHDVINLSKISEPCRCNNFDGTSRINIYKSLVSLPCLEKQFWNA